MKLAIISDLHYGIKNDFIPFLDNNKKFLDEVFFPILEIENVNNIVCLGDLFDRRKYVNFYTAYRLQKDFFEKLKNKNLTFNWILGNHDIYFRNSLRVGASNVIKGPYQIFDSPTELYWRDGSATSEDQGTEILFIPWITNENHEETIQTIKKSKAQICFGHFELQGFEMNNGVVNTTGASPDILNKFDVVLSGHFHQKVARGNITYVGAHAEFTWADFGKERGFHIFDTVTRSLTFYKNPYTVFSKIYYDDAKGSPNTPAGGFESLSNKIVKVVVSGKNDPQQYDWFITQVENAGPLDISIVEDHLHLNLTGDDKIMEESKDTLGIIREYVKQSHHIVNTEKLDTLVVELYNQAQEAE